VNRHRKRHRPALVTSTRALDESDVAKHPVGIDGRPSGPAEGFGAHPVVARADDHLPLITLSTLLKNAA